MRSSARNGYHKKNGCAGLCCGSVTYWYGSGSGSVDLCLRLMDPDHDPAIFVSDLQDTVKNLFFCILLFEGTLTSFFKD
jgi:hypothetical protein